MELSDLIQPFLSDITELLSFLLTLLIFKDIKSSSCTTTKMAHNTGTDQTAYVYIAVISEYFFSDLVNI